MKYLGSSFLKLLENKELTYALFNFLPFPQNSVIYPRQAWNVNIEDSMTFSGHKEHVGKPPICMGAIFTTWKQITFIVSQVNTPCFTAKHNLSFKYIMGFIRWI